MLELRTISSTLNLGLMRFWYNELADTAVVGMAMPFSCDYLRALRVRMDAHVGRTTCSEIVLGLSLAGHV